MFVYQIAEESCRSQEVLLYDIIEGVVVKRYRGQQQGVDFIRSTFGGPSRGFIISGSEG